MLPRISTARTPHVDASAPTDALGVGTTASTSAALNRVVTQAAAHGIVPSTADARDAALPLSPRSILSPRIDPHVQCSGSELPPDVERTLRESGDRSRDDDIFASGASPQRDCMPASPLRASAPTREFFDRYLDAQPRPWSSDTEQRYVRLHPRNHTTEYPTTTVSQTFSARTVHVTPAMTERLKLAKHAIDLTRALLCLGPGNQVRNMELNGLEATSRLSLLQYEFDEIGKQRAGSLSERGLEQLRALLAIKWETGACAEHAALTMSILSPLPELRDVAIEMIGNESIDHCLVVIRDPNPERDIVIDAWSVLPVPCLKTDAANELAAMADRANASGACDTNVNEIIVRKAVGEVWPELDIDFALRARRDPDDEVLNDFRDEPNRDEYARLSRDNCFPFDALYNGDPSVRYVKTHSADDASSSSADTAFGFRYERAPSAHLRAMSSLSAPSLSASRSSAAVPARDDAMDECSSRHPASALHSHAMDIDEHDDEDAPASDFVDSIVAPPLDPDSSR